MNCPYCRTANQAYAGFCLNCGEALDGGAPGAGEPAPATLPPRPAGGRLGGWIPHGRWERLLGLALALLLGVAGVGDLVGEQARVDNYRAGRAAEAARHWTPAAAAYALATGYRDAADRAHTAAAQVAARDQAYSQGQAAAARQAWTAAQTAFAKVAAIEPDYAQVQTRLAEATQEATATAAAGLVYRRMSAPAGLYLQGPLDRPAALLPASDGASHVLAFTPDGTRVIYDGPAEAGARGLYLTALAPLNRQAPIGRVQRLPGGLPVDGWGIFCPGGFWWFSENPSTLTYYDFAREAATPVAPAAPLQVLNQDVVHGRLLLAAPYTENGLIHTRILLAAPDGQDPHLLVDTPGQVQTAERSPDGNWLLYSREEVGAMTLYGHGDDGWVGIWWQPGRDDARTTTLVLTWIGTATGPVAVASDRTAPLRERMLDHYVVPDDRASPGGTTAHFAPGAPASVVVNHEDRSERMVTIYEAPTGLQTTFWPDAPPTQNLGGPFFSPGGHYVLIEEARTDGTRLLVQPVGGPRPTDRQSVQVPSYPGGLVLGQVSLQEDYLLYLVGRPRSRANREEYTLYSLPLAADAPTPAPAPVALFTALYGQNLGADPDITLAPGGAQVAYIRPDGTLLARPLDGAGTTVLATDVREVWSPLP